MSSPCWRRSLHIFMLVCLRLTNAATESRPTTEQTPSGTPTTDGGTFNQTTPAPWGPTTPAPLGLTTKDQSGFDPTSSSTTEGTNGDSNFTATTNQTDSEALVTVQIPTEPTSPTSVPVVLPDVCLCDLSPELCDIGCCCDVLDCGVSDLNSVFSGCPKKTRSGACVEDWLLFRSNVDPALVTRIDGLFCVRPPDNGTIRSAPSLAAVPALGDSYRFSGPEPLATKPHSRPFYRVDDVIQTYYSTLSLRGLLRQPSPGAGSAFCVDRNPAKFLRSSVVSCTRVVSASSCSTDPALRASSYYSDLKLLRLPVAESEQLVDMLVPVTPRSSWPAPSSLNQSCLNVVSRVELVVGFTERGELTYASLSVVLADVGVDRFLSQTHSLRFELATPRPTPAGPIPAVGLPMASPVFGRFKDSVEPITVLGVSEGGECSTDYSRRSPVLFPRNTITGCFFSSGSGVCSELRSQLYQVLQGEVSPELLAMSWGAEPAWTRVLLQDCPPANPEESCETGCTLPRSLSIKVLWARLGWTDLPQNHILGAKYTFQCVKVKCSSSFYLTLSAEVRFADTTAYHPPPRARPQPTWRLPFGFFSRGVDELDGHTASDGGAWGVVRPSSTLTLVLMTTMLLVG
ncbi:tectonic-3-like [Gadus chalcogrammus]|uniref:tectonic-3-like n=1 Tax=Gadus chalcogrammus TaxID=1042646 RepID=UPI0024C4783D|nr:tectonic-3-like [Gadus chalcogrammus]